MSFRLTPTVRALVVAGAVAALAVCGEPFTPPPDYEDPSIPPLSSGLCDGVPVTRIDELYDPGGPAPGTVVAVDGTPWVQMTCTRPADNACEPYDEDGDGECCGCWLDDQCTYRVRGEEWWGQLCVFNPAFVCGFGYHCGAACVPFSGDPDRRYRFVGTLRPPGSSGIDVTKYCWIDT
jgi:hypothetical protein